MPNSKLVLSPYSPNLARKSSAPNVTPVSLKCFADCVPNWHISFRLISPIGLSVIMITSTSAALKRSLFQCEDTTHRRGRDSTPGLHRWNTAPPSHWRTAACGRGRYITTASSGHSSPTPPTPMGATHHNLPHSYRLAPSLSPTITSSIRQFASALAWHTGSPTPRASATTSASAHRFKVVSCQSQPPALAFPLL